MNLLQESQQTYEKIEKSCADAIKAKEAIVADVDTNIRLQKAAKQEKLDRLAYYKSMMIDTNTGKQETTTSTAKPGVQPRSTSRNPSKKDQQMQQPGKTPDTVTSTEATTASAMQLASLPGGRGKVQVQSQFNIYLAQKGATQSEIKRINETINELVVKAQVKQEDMNNKIELLKKIEIKFHHLVEMRNVFQFFDSKTLLQKEKAIKEEIAQENYDNRRKRNQEALDTAAQKTLQKIANKKNLVVAKNIRNAERSKKEELKIKNTETVKTPPEVEEMRRYLGQMPDTWEQEMFEQHEKRNAAATASKH